MNNFSITKPLNKSLNEDANKPENPFISILINVIIPVFILNKLSDKFGPITVLLIALAFPLIYGLYDFTKRKKANFIALLGFLNVLFTGGLAIFSVKGIWFALKEAIFPLLIGFFVFLSSFTKKPFIKMIFLNPVTINTPLINEKLAENNNEQNFSFLLKKYNIFFSFSFFLSAILNFILAIYIFTDIDPLLSEQARTIILNKQIAEMIWLGYIVIAIPCLILTSLIFYYLIKELKKLTNLSFYRLINNPKI